MLREAKPLAARIAAQGDSSMSSRMPLSYRSHFIITTLCVLSLVVSISPPSTAASVDIQGEGILTIHSSSESPSSFFGLSGHSWIEYTPYGAPTVTFGTWGNVDPRGVWINRELGWGDGQVSRTTQISEVQEQALFNYINSEIALGTDVWKSTRNCSYFAANAWKAATGEWISPGFVPNPTALRKNIWEANGGQPHMFVGGGTTGGVESGPLRKLSYLGAEPAVQTPLSFTLDSVLPSVGPNNTTPIFVTPQLTMELGNAIEARGVDFRQNGTDESTTVAVALVTKTLQETYWHDYTLCSRFHGYELNNTMPIAVSGLTGWLPDGQSKWFWYSQVEKADTLEEALLFSVFVNETEHKFVVDSRWLSSEYACHWREPSSPSFDYVLNYQIWSSSALESYTLLQSVFQKLSEVGPGWIMAFDNSAEPITPTLVMNAAGIRGDTVWITAQSWLTEPRLVLFYGTKRLCKTCSDIPFEHWEVMYPNLNFIKLSLGSMDNAVIYAAADGFIDKIFVSTEGSAPPNIYSFYLPIVSGGEASFPMEPSINISWPQDNASVIVEKDLTNIANDYQLTIHGTVHGMRPGWTVSVDVYTNDWYPQEAATVKGELWGARVYLAGQYEYNNHKIRVTLKNENGVGMATDIVSNIVRINPCQAP
jgi:hypothetical protein